MAKIVISANNKSFKSLKFFPSRCSVAKGWWNPGRDFKDSPFFGPEVGEDQKKGLAAKLLGFRGK